MQSPAVCVRELSVKHSDEVVTVTSADFQRNIELYQDEALKRPVAITENGRPRTVLISAEEYERRLKGDVAGAAFGLGIIRSGN